MSTKKQLATLAGGCFWCTEAVFQQVSGVLSVVSGYAGGNVPNPTYDAVCAGSTGHAEAIQLEFDPKTITYEEILQIFFYVHDPTTLNRQGNDIGYTTILIPVALIWSGAEYWFKRTDRAVLMAASLITMPLYVAIKAIFQRARPVTEFIANSGLHNDSFPSGHSAGSFAVYVTLAYLLYRQLPKPWSAILSTFFVTIAILIGFSRVYLGAHFPTDVLGGWLLASLVLLGLRLALGKYEQSEGTTEKV